MSTPDWKSLAAKRHSPSMLAGAAAVLAVPYLYADPGVIHYGAAWVDLKNGHWRSLFKPIFVPQKEFAIGPLQVFW